MSAAVGAFLGLLAAVVVGVGIIIVVLAASAFLSGSLAAAAAAAVEDFAAEVAAAVSLQWLLFLLPCIMCISLVTGPTFCCCVSLVVVSIYRQRIV